MPRKKLPQRKIIFLSIPKENQIQQRKEQAKPKSLQKKYKNLRVARLDYSFCNVQKFNLKLNSEFNSECDKKNNIDSGKNENIDNSSTENEQTDQKNKTNKNSMIQHINIDINHKFDLLISTFNENIDNDLSYDESYDSWNVLF